MSGTREKGRTRGGLGSRLVSFHTDVHYDMSDGVCDFTLSEIHGHTGLEYTLTALLLMHAGHTAVPVGF